MDDYTCSELNMFAHLCPLIWIAFFSDVSHVIFHFLSCNCFLSLPRISFFFPLAAHFSAACFSFPPLPGPLCRNYLCVRGVKHTPRNGKATQSQQHLPLPLTQTLFRCQREDAGILLSNLTSNKDSQTFSLMTSGNKASVLVTPHYQVRTIQKFESLLQIWKK